jgi:hypothetical protein
MTRGTEKEPSDRPNGPVLNGTAVEEVKIDMYDDPNSLLAQRLYEIKKDKQLTWLLEDWEKQFKASRDSRLQQEAQLKNAKNEVYEWIGFNSVFQGVVITGVALSNTLGCRQSWGPTSLSLIASIVTIVTVHFKLLDYDKLKLDVKRVTAQAKQLHAQLAELKLRGKDSEFSWFSEPKDSRGRSKRKVLGRKDRYYWAAIGALLLFSSGLVLFCNITLCGLTK